MAFLEVLTRCYKRPVMLGNNRRSLAAQTDPDWEQVFLDDVVGRGVPWAQENLAHYSTHLRGRYIWILDDDDQCIRPTLVAELKAIAAAHDPDVIMVKMDHGIRGILPDVGYWGQPPVCAHVGCSAYVVRREVWQAHAAAWLPGSYASDFNFINAIFASNPRVYWHEVIASEVQRISLGYPE